MNCFATWSLDEVKASWYGEALLLVSAICKGVVRRLRHKAAATTCGELSAYLVNFVYLQHLPECQHVIFKDVVMQHITTNRMLAL